MYNKYKRQSKEELSARDDPEPAQPNSNAPSTSGLSFTIDDLPYHKWHGRLQEFYTWMNARSLNPEIGHFDILLEFVSRFNKE